MNCIPVFYEKAEEITKQIAAWVLLYLWGIGHGVWGMDFDDLVALKVYSSFLNTQ